MNDRIKYNCDKCRYAWTHDIGLICSNERSSSHEKVVDPDFTCEYRLQRNKRSPAPQCPTEESEQKSLFEWAELFTGKYPELALMYHIPNGGARNRIVGYKLKTQGVKRGVPDLCLPVARGGYHALYVELKRLKGGSVSKEQREWLYKLSEQNYKCVLAKGWKEAKNAIEEYLGIGDIK